jgi:transposase
MKYRMKDKRARNERIMAYHKEGYTLRAIAGIFHTSVTTIWKIVKREGSK